MRGWGLQRVTKARAAEAAPQGEKVAYFAPGTEVECLC